MYNLQLLSYTYIYTSELHTLLPHFNESVHLKKLGMHATKHVHHYLYPPSYFGNRNYRIKIYIL